MCVCYPMKSENQLQDVYRYDQTVIDYYIIIVIYVLVRTFNKLPLNTGLHNPSYPGETWLHKS